MGKGDSGWAGKDVQALGESPFLPLLGGSTRYVSQRHLLLSKRRHLPARGESSSRLVGRAGRKGRRGIKRRRMVTELPAGLSCPVLPPPPLWSPGAA